MEVLFPSHINKERPCLNGNAIIANLPLQMSLYFNIVLFPVWFVSTVFLVNLKFDCYSQIYQVVVVTVIGAIVLLELIRLYLGFSGNLEDKIHDLAGFWMVSILIQFPLQCFLTFNPHMRLLITEMVLQVLMLGLLIIQLGSGYVALRKVAKFQVIQFQIKQMEIESPKLD